MKIVCLMENTTHCDLTAKHGLSLYLETGGRKILFDMGPDGSFADNAEKLGVDLTRVDLAVLSHGHYDHGGGLQRFLELNDHAPVYVHAKAFGTFRNRSGKYIGLDPALQGNPRLVSVDQDTEIGEGMVLTSCDERTRPYPANAYGLTCEEEGKEPLPDRFLHEQYLVVTEKEKRIVLSGCSHKGILNIVSWLRPDVLIGGFHLKDESFPEILDQTAKQLLASGALFYTCHCTGQPQYERLKALMGEKLHYLSCGEVIEV